MYKTNGVSQAASNACFLLGPWSMATRMPLPLLLWPVSLSSSGFGTTGINEGSFTSSSCTLRPLQGFPNPFVVCFCLLAQTNPNRSMKQKLLRVKLVLVSVFGSWEVCASTSKISTRIK